MDLTPESERPRNRTDRRRPGLPRRFSQTREYSSWQAMHARCGNPNASGYANYGGRGIKVCERWRDFAAFLADMGSRPDGHSLDRIDAEGDYEPGNCRWATALEQRRNRSRFIRPDQIPVDQRRPEDWEMITQPRKPRARGEERNTERGSE